MAASHVRDGAEHHGRREGKLNWQRRQPEGAGHGATRADYDLVEHVARGHGTAAIHRRYREIECGLKRLSRRGAHDIRPFRWEKLEALFERGADDVRNLYREARVLEEPLRVTKVFSILVRE